MGTCERLLRIEAPADEVWKWMLDPKNILGVNIFHAKVETDKTELAEGDLITVEHDFFGAFHQKRQAKIREVKPYYLAFGEFKDRDVPGLDPFPHTQSFQVVPVDDDSCIVVNRISGRYIFPGSSLFGEKLFEKYVPVILDDDNQMIAIGCGAMAPRKLNVPKGLLVYPAWLAAARFAKKSTRRKMLEKMRTEMAGKAADEKSPEPATTAS
jgi:ligand-binding SRPBCC domain-containing protein